VAKFSPDGTQLIWSTYFPESADALAVDGSGSVYVAGETEDPNFPSTPAVSLGQVRTGYTARSGAFLTKISASGDRIVYSAVLVAGSLPCYPNGSTCALASAWASGTGVAVDAAGNAYLAGNTDTFMGALGGGKNGIGGFVAKINAAGTAISYLTFIGQGFTSDIMSAFPFNGVSSIAADGLGNAYTAGYTSDSHFPVTPGAYQTVGAGAFVIKLGPDGTAQWATYLGARGAESPKAMALDSSGTVWVCGTTTSADFPNSAGSVSGDFIAGLSSSGSALSYGTVFPTGIASQSLAVDSAGLLHMAGPGALVSTVKPVQTMAPRVFGVANAAAGPLGGRVSPGEVISIYGAHIGPAQPVAAIPDSSGTYPTTLGGVQVSLDFYGYLTPLPLLSVSDSQISTVAPPVAYWVAGISQIIRVTVNGEAVPGFTVALGEADPQIFQSSNGFAAAVNQDGSINSAAHPAKPGSVISIWATGVGLINTNLTTGKVATAAGDLFCCTVYNAAYSDFAADVLYGGTAPGIVTGVVQINFQVSASSRTYFIGARDRASKPVTIYITP